LYFLFAKNITFEKILLKYFPQKKTEQLPVNNLDKMTGKKRKANKVIYDDDEEEKNKENEMPATKLLKEEEFTPAPIARQSMIIITANQSSSPAGLLLDQKPNEETDNNNNLLDYAYPSEATPIKTLEDTIMETQQTSEHIIELVDEKIDIDDANDKMIETAENTIEETLSDSKKIDIDKAKQSNTKQKKIVSFATIQSRIKIKASETVETLPYSSSSTSIPDSVENSMHSSSSSMVLRERLVVI